MQVAENTVEGLKRVFTVTLPADEISKQEEARLAELGKDARLPGFRPGKAPMAMLKQRYGANVRGEVLEKSIVEANRTLFNDRGLRPALQPQVEITAYDDGQDLTYTLTFDVLPEVTPCDFKTITVERIVVTPSEADVDKAIADLASMRKPTKKVDEARASKTGDSVKIDFDGSVDGERRPGMKGEGYMLELGSNSFIPGFEEQVTGMKAGEQKTITVTFPADYHAKELAAKEAQFIVTVHELHESDAAEANDELAKGFGFETLAQLREKITQNMADSFKQAARQKAKRELLDLLAKAHDFEVPQSMVDFEFESIWKQREAQGPDPEEKGTTEDEIKAEYRDIAERRVRLGLLLAEIGQKQKIDVTENELRQAIFEAARQYPGQERQVVEYFSRNTDALNSLRAPIFEDKVVDFIFELVNVTEKQGTVDDLKGETESEAAAA